MLAVYTLAIVSCGSDKLEKKFSVKKPPAENLNDLKEKYKDKEFKNCDEFIVASEEMCEVYFKTIDKAIEGDESAKKDIEAFKDFSNNWKNDAEILKKDCPEKFEESQNKFAQNMGTYMVKLIKLYAIEDELSTELENERLMLDLVKY